MVAASSQDAEGASRSRTRKAGVRSPAAAKPQPRSVRRGCGSWAHGSLIGILAESVSVQSLIRVGNHPDSLSLAATPGAYSGECRRSAARGVRGQPRRGSLCRRGDECGEDDGGVETQCSEGPRKNVALSRSWAKWAAYRCVGCAHEIGFAMMRANFFVHLRSQRGARTAAHWRQCATCVNCHARGRSEALVTSFRIFWRDEPWEPCRSRGS